MGTPAPVIVAEMADWTALGGGNSGIVANPATHDYGFHMAANEVPASDYSRTRDPNGSDGPYVSWDYACAGDFSHRNDERLRAMHRNVLARLMAGQLPMICEFIGKPWADQPVYYWARWNGVGTLQRYTGAGHDRWSHISWYRSRVDERAYLWTPASGGGGAMALGDRTIRQGDQGDDVWELQDSLARLGYTVGPTWGIWERDGATTAAVKAFQGAQGLGVDGIVGPLTSAAVKAAAAALPPPPKPDPQPEPKPEPAPADAAGLAAALAPLIIPPLVEALAAVAAPKLTVTLTGTAERGE